MSPQLLGVVLVAGVLALALTLAAIESWWTR